MAICPRGRSRFTCIDYVSDLAWACVSEIAVNQEVFQDCFWSESMSTKHAKLHIINQATTDIIKEISQLLLVSFTYVWVLFLSWKLHHLYQVFATILAIWNQTCASPNSCKVVKAELIQLMAQKYVTNLEHLIVFKVSMDLCQQLDWLSSWPLLCFTNHFFCLQCVVCTNLQNSTTVALMFIF